MRSCGCSGRKADYILELAAQVSDGRLPAGGWHRRDDAEIYQRLVALPGIGPWTVEMCLMFRFGRPDVFSPADIGIRRAMEKAYELPLGLKRRPGGRWPKKSVSHGGRGGLSLVVFYGKPLMMTFLTKIENRPQ